MDVRGYTGQHAPPCSGALGPWLARQSVPAGTAE
jgi:hypothetical protein